MHYEQKNVFRGLEEMMGVEPVSAPFAGLLFKWLLPFVMVEESQARMEFFSLP